MKNSFLLGAFASLLANAPLLHAQNIFARQRVIIIMMDGFGEQYYRNAAMPFLQQMEQQGIYKIVPSLMPAVTNVNNISIATGSTPAQNGITGNVFFNERQEAEEYIEDPSLILTPSVFERAHRLGIPSALLSVKQKTIDLLGKYADYTLCPEGIAGGQVKWEHPPALSGVYSREINYELMDAANNLLKNKPEVKLVYIHTTDYPMHMWPPDNDSVKTFLSEIDRRIAQLHQTAPDAAILLTADHGMNHKTQAWDLQKVCAEKQTPVKIVISPEKDKYVKHHKGLGGAAYVYLLKSSDSAGVRSTLSALKGVDAVLTKSEAATRFHLLPGRIGDFMVLGDINTVFGELNGHAYEQLPDTYRSHGSTYEAQVPLFVYNVQQAPPAAYFDWNYKLAAWLFSGK
ncbi:alkaline phosphatase family protein [Chitinophaga arvensicola]|uniref:Phosphonoacetate hydrolase n=1 Tax=Chitinophaga arvensicola TaxID=29529 RepID=A0A1I0S789_9BACT|nr:alkaline phosphatase family protein [Chitinophaga arvensicola]SEW51544.1 phosphonoacetate hydrolase [Chitinophaga arvensicola]